MHKFYFIDFHFRFFDYKSLIISRIKNKQTLICYLNAYFSVGFSQNGNSEYNYIYFLSNTFVPLVLVAQLNITHCFVPLIFKSHQNNAQVTASLFFSTGDRLKHTVYVCKCLDVVTQERRSEVKPQWGNM